jgi:membrane protein implicated in regulation of membrane protease activity
MTTDQIIPGAIAAAILILVIVGVVRGVTRRRGRNEDTFGAGGVATVAAGTRGVAKTDLAPSGVVRVVGEQWTARSASGMAIPSGTTIRVVSQEGLTLIVDPQPAGPPAEG